MDECKPLFLGIARIAGHHRLTDVMDHLVATLCKFAAPGSSLHGGAGAGGGGAGGGGGSGSSRPAVQFGEDDRARTAAVTAFTVANRYGDSLRGGWRGFKHYACHVIQLTVTPCDATPCDVTPRDTTPCDITPCDVLALPTLNPIPKTLN